MCTFHDDRTVMVCDIIRERMQRELAALGPDVTFTPVERQGTLVRASERVDAARFRRRVQAVIDAGPDGQVEDPAGWSAGKP